MLRAIVTALLMFGPTLVLVGTAGCEDKVVTVQESEQRHVSEPQMTSPGKEKVE